MKMHFWFHIAVILLPALIGCQERGGDKQRVGDGSGEKLYDVKAKVIGVAADKKSVTLDHEDIPGLMKAMEMKFKVENPEVLDGVKPGDRVHGKLKVKAGDYIISELHRQ